MPRNHLKSLPTAILRRGLAHVHPACHAPGPPFAGAEPAATPQQVPPAADAPPANAA